MSRRLRSRPKGLLKPAEPVEKANDVTRRRLREAVSSLDELLSRVEEGRFTLPDEFGEELSLMAPETRAKLKRVIEAIDEAMP